MVKVKKKSVTLFQNSNLLRWLDSYTKRGKNPTLASPTVFDLDNTFAQ